jgi:hypothetical protein
VTAGRARSSRLFDFDYSLGRSAGAPPSPRVLQGTDRVAFPPLCRYPLHSLAERRGMCEPSSSHLGASWNGVLGCIPAPARREQDHCQAKDSLGPSIHLCNVCDPREVEAFEARCRECGCAEMNEAKPALSHGSLVVIKWTVCHLRETVCLPEAWRETITAPSGDEWGSWRMGDVLNNTGVERPPQGPL